MTELKFASTLIVAENFNIPAIVQSSGMPGGVESIQDKLHFQMWEVFLYKMFFTPCWQWIDGKRAENNLPELDFQGRFIKSEYIPAGKRVYTKNSEKL